MNNATMNELNRRADVMAEKALRFYYYNNSDQDAEAMLIAVRNYRALRKTIDTAHDQPHEMHEGVRCCPSCGGQADNGFDHCVPPNPHRCTKCGPKIRSYT